MGINGYNVEVTVMENTGDLQDVKPGKYKVQDIFSFDDMPALKPRYTEIRGVKWTSNKETSKGTLEFPPDFNVLQEIEVEVGTNEFVSYYGCTITNTRQGDEVTLNMRHAIEDFTYSNHYLHEWVLHKNGNEGAGLERHNFCHVDCPRDRDNGTFIL